MVTWVVVNCWSRLYLGVHYPGDLVAGVALGTLCGAGVALMQKLACKQLVRRRLPQDDSRLDVSTFFKNGTTLADTTIIWMAGCLVAIVLAVCSLFIYYL